MSEVCCDLCAYWLPQLKECGNMHINKCTNKEHFVKVERNCGTCEREIRAEAIDGFAENLKRKILEEIYDVSDRQKNYEVGSDMSMTCSHIMGTLRDVRHRIVDEVVEQMKAGGKNESN